MIPRSCEKYKIVRTIELLCEKYIVSMDDDSVTFTSGYKIVFEENRHLLYDENGNNYASIISSDGLDIIYVEVTHENIILRFAESRYFEQSVHPMYRLPICILTGGVYDRH